MLNQVSLYDARKLIEASGIDYESEVVCTALEERLGATLQLLENHRPKSCLDIGCRRGIMTWAIQQKVMARVVGVDIDEIELRYAGQRSIASICTNVDRAVLPFQNEAFDCVILAEVFEHLSAPNHVLAEINRVTISQGGLLITTPNLIHLKNRLTFALYGKDPIQLSNQDFGNVHKREYTITSIRYYLERHGFTIHETIWLTYPGSRHLITSIYKKLIVRLWPQLAEIMVLWAVKE